MAIETTPLASSFTRGGLRCNRLVFDFSSELGREFNLTWVVGNQHGCITLNLLGEPRGGSSWPHRYPFEHFINGRYWLPAVVARHTLRPLNEYDTECGPCLFLDGLPCYGDSSGMLAQDIMGTAVQRDDENVIWDTLIAVHHGWIEEAIREAQLESPLEGPKRDSD